MQVSHSRIETFKQCPYKFKLRYVDELEAFPNYDPANPLVIGTALHTGIEQDAKTAIEEYHNHYPIVSDLNINEQIKLEAVIEMCRNIVPRGLYETKIECPEFKGFIDLLVPIPNEELTPDDRCDVCDIEENCGHAYSGNNACMSKIQFYDMYDFKYSNNVKNYSESGQLHEYKFYFEKLNPTKKIRNMYFLFAPKVMIRQKKTENLDQFRLRLKAELKTKEPTLLKVDYNPEKVKEFLRSAKECKEARTFNKNPSRLCDWCEYQKYCESNEKEDLNIMNLPKNERRSVTANDHKKMWLYGAPFSGKTYLANKFPDPLMLNTDGNVKYVDAPFIPIKDKVTVEGRITKRKFAWEVFKETISELEKKQNDFKTIVVDLLEDTYEYCRLFMYDQLGISHESDDSFRAWDKVRTEFLSTIKRLMNLDYENIILISHEDSSKDLTKKGGDKITAIKPNINDKAALKIAGMVDLVARVIADDDIRTLSFKTNEVIFGGGRLKLDVGEIMCSYNELCEVYENSNAGKVKAEESKPEVKPETEPEVETADNPPAEVETADAPPKRKRRAKATEEPQEEPQEEETPVEDNPVEDEEPPKRRRRKTED